MVVIQVFFVDVFFLLYFSFWCDDGVTNAYTHTSRDDTMLPNRMFDLSRQCPKIIHFFSFDFCCCGSFSFTYVTVDEVNGIWTLFLVFVVRSFSFVFAYEPAIVLRTSHEQRACAIKLSLPEHFANPHCSSPSSFVVHIRSAFLFHTIFLCWTSRVTLFTFSSSLPHPSSSRRIWETKFWARPFVRCTPSISIGMMMMRYVVVSKRLKRPGTLFIV